MPDHILLVEDETMILNFLARILEARGFLVTTTRNGRKALEVVKSHSVDLMITDLRLQDMDGLDVLEQAKSLDSRIEVIVLTGFVTDQNREKALVKGAFSFLAKPLESMDELYSDISNALQRQRIKTSGNNPLSLPYHLDFLLT